MNTFIKQLKRAAEEVRLDAREKQEMRIALRAAMHAPSGPVPSPYHFFFSRALVPLSLVLVLAVGGGTAYAAQGALPGDALYPVKRAVNERVEGALALSREAKAKFDARVASRRLAEASALSSKGHLSDDVEAELAADFDAHAEKLIRRIEEEPEASIEETRSLAASFEDELAAYAPPPAPVAEAENARGASLMMVVSDASEKATERPLETSVRAARERLEHVRARIEEKRVEIRDVGPEKEKTESLERATTTPPEAPERPHKERGRGSEDGD
jgi:hypothetical protein